MIACEYSGVVREAFLAAGFNETEAFELTYLTMECGMRRR